MAWRGVLINHSSVACAEDYNRIILDPWSPHKQVGPYTLVSPLGEGGMGEVWKARDTRLSRFVAIKRLTGAYAARFQQEARAIAALNHTNICQLYDVGD